jgi:N-glycosylase/DNA lyase
MTDEEWNRDPRTVALRKEILTLSLEYLERIKGLERQLEQEAGRRRRADETLEGISALVASRVLADQSRQRSARAKVAAAHRKAREAGR